MKNAAFIIVALVALLSVGCDKRRYELVCSPYTMNNGTYIGMRVLDTYNGEVWGFTGPHRDQDSNWIYLGNPEKLKLK